jgi:hypothetical protein
LHDLPLFTNGIEDRRGVIPRRYGNHKYRILEKFVARCDQSPTFAADFIE